MLTQDYLNLRLVRLKGAEQWACKDEGLVFLFALAGTGHYLKGAARQPLGPGDVLVVNGEPDARIALGKGVEFAFSGFFIRLDHLFPLFATIEISQLQTVIEGFKGFKFYPASSPLARQCHKLIEEVSPEFNLDHRAQCLRLAASILNSEFMSARGKRTGFIPTKERLEQVFESLSAEDMLQMSVPELAQRFGCSRRQLNRLFQRYLGFSVASLRMEVRLLKALSLLRNQDAKILHVAEQCGFNHQGLFNTCFRRRFKTSPSQWRKTAFPETKAGDKGLRTREDWPLQIPGLGRLIGTPMGKAEPINTTRTSGQVSARSSPNPELQSKLPSALSDEASGMDDPKIKVSVIQESTVAMAFQVFVEQ